MEMVAKVGKSDRILKSSNQSLQIKYCLTLMKTVWFSDPIIWRAFCFLRSKSSSTGHLITHIFQWQFNPAHKTKQCKLLLCNYSDPSKRKCLEQFGIKLAKGAWDFWNGTNPFTQLMKFMSGEPQNCRKKFPWLTFSAHSLDCFYWKGKGKIMN